MKNIVLGAGPAGLGAAMALRRAGQSLQIFERQANPGGLAQTDEIEGFLFDRASHYLHVRNPEFRQILSATNVAMTEIERRSGVIMGKSIIPYPIQYNLWAFNEIEQALIERDLIRQHEFSVLSSPENLMQAFSIAWGATLVDRFFKPYNEKLLGRSLSSVPHDCLGRFVPNFDRELMLESRASSSGCLGYNANFLYPASGRIDDVFKSIANEFRGDTNFGEEIGQLYTLLSTRAVA